MTTRPTRKGQRIDRFVAPRRYVPREMRAAKVGSIEESTSLALAHLIQRRIQLARYRCAVVVVDIDGTCYATKWTGQTIDNVLNTYPQIVVGTYDGNGEAADMAADIEIHRRARFQA
jgi:hypothetical protein